MLKDLYWFKEDSNVFAASLKEQMKKNKLTYDGLLEALNYEYADETVKKWRTGERTPELETIVRLAKLLHISAEQLYLPDSLLHVEENKYTNMVYSSKCDKHTFPYLTVFYLIEDYRCGKITKAELIDELKQQQMLMEELNYLIQKKAFAYLNDFEEQKLKIYSNTILFKYEYDDEMKENRAKSFDYSKFWDSYDMEFSMRKGKSYKFKLDKETAKEELFELRKHLCYAPFRLEFSLSIKNLIELAIAEGFIDIVMDMMDGIQLNCVYTYYLRVGNREIAEKLYELGAKEIKIIPQDISCVWDVTFYLINISYEDYLNALGGE